MRNGIGLPTICLPFLSALLIGQPGPGLDPGPILKQDHRPVLRHVSRFSQIEPNGYLMRQKGHLKLIIGLGVAGIALLAGLLYLRAENTGKSVAHENAPEPTIEDIQRTVMAQNESLLNSNEAKIFIQGDLALAEKIIQNPANESERVKFFETGIHVLNRDIQKLSPEKSEALYKLTIDYISENQKTFLGKNARTMTLAVRMIKKLPQPKSNTENYKKSISLVRARKLNGIYQLGLELTTSWKPLPSETEEAIRADISSKDPNVVYMAIQTMQSCEDQDAKLRLASNLNSRYLKLPEGAQPLALKVLALNKDAKSINIRPFIKSALKKSSDQWVDAAVSAIEVLSINDYKDEIVHLRGTTSNPILQQRIEQLVSQLQGGSK